MIYFVQLDSGAIKIGFTDSLEQRLTDIRLDRATSVALLATLPGGREEERKLHKQFAHLRLGKTEQFRPAKELMEFIDKPLLVSPNPDAVEVQPYDRTKAIRRSYTVSEDTDRQIADLAAWWGGVAELPAAQVIREAVRRAWEIEAEFVEQQTAAETPKRNRRPQKDGGRKDEGGRRN